MIHTLETSEPGDLPDDLVMATAHTDSLRGRGDCSFVLPQRTTREMPLVVLLHGVYGSHWSWPLLGRAGSTLNRLVAEDQVQPMVLAMPSDGLTGSGSAYVDGPDRDVSTWITSDVPEIASGLAPSLGDTWFIGGLSLGGWGAIRLAITSGVRFAGVSAHSSVIRIDDLSAVGPRGFDVTWLGEDERDLGTILADHRDRLPPVRFDCGTDDHWLSANREMHQLLEARGVSHGYFEYPGAHDWKYWRERLPDSLRFFQALIDDPS